MSVILNAARWLIPLGAAAIYDLLLTGCGKYTEDCHDLVGGKPFPCGRDGGKNVSDGGSRFTLDCEEEEPFTGEYVMETIYTSKYAPPPSISRCGRYVVYNSPDIFLYDRRSQNSSRVNVGPGEVETNGESSYALISATGRFVTFVSRANRGPWNAFLRDLEAGVTSSVTVNFPGGTSYGRSPMSEDGRYVAVASLDSILVRDLLLGANEMVSLLPAPYEAVESSSYSPAMDPTGRHVTFISSFFPPDLYPRQVFLRDREASVAELVSVGTDWRGGDGSRCSASVSSGGRFVTFSSFAKDGRQVFLQVFLRDRETGTTEHVSVAPDGSPGNGLSSVCGTSSISEDGRFVAFRSRATNLVPGETGNRIYVRDRLNGVTRRVDPTEEGEPADSVVGLSPVLSGNGRFVVFASHSTGDLFVVGLEHFFGPIGR